MSALRTTRMILTLAAPAAAAVLVAGPATALPPHPFGLPALTIGCPNQASPMSLTAATGQSGPEPGIAPGEIRFQSFPAAPPIPAAGQVTVAWLNTTTGRNGVVNLEGAYPYQSKTVFTGHGEVIATAFASISLGPAVICQNNPTVGTFIV
ncbi:putative secreted protein [Rhodococcus sp. MTM3W5.2]|uniref:hypothetical protein n=1 Tax=Rhodococcus sp. MTM3W5.2 TaxID=1805827 RepID=UPI000979469C|nr:hypothetical protein [Rhodococcus sp. MTM3W5.2]AQA20720.1 putative secreted protein [Rhodococcus sp. MTM3W5.2]